ncbi:MAG: hypothetical protein H6Q06_1994, partial [Acidobacteria bacterium]|nr:hypothetical protein [Acidobacteriota bacterium]
LNRVTGGEMRWQTVAAYVRIAAASVLMGVAADLIYRLAQWVLPGGGTLRLAVHLAFAMFGAMALLVPLLELFKVEEARELSLLLKRKLLRR